MPQNGSRVPSRSVGRRWFRHTRLQPLQHPIQCLPPIGFVQHFVAIVGQEHACLDNVPISGLGRAIAVGRWPRLAFHPHPVSGFPFANRPACAQPRRGPSLPARQAAVADPQRARSLSVFRPTCYQPTCFGRRSPSVSGRRPPCMRLIHLNKRTHGEYATDAPGQPNGRCNPATHVPKLA